MSLVQQNRNADSWKRHWLHHGSDSLFPGIFLGVCFVCGLNLVMPARGFASLPGGVIVACALEAVLGAFVVRFSHCDHLRRFWGALLGAGCAVFIYGGDGYPLLMLCGFLTGAYLAAGKTKRNVFFFGFFWSALLWEHQGWSGVCFVPIAWALGLAFPAVLRYRTWGIRIVLLSCVLGLGLVGAWEGRYQETLRKAAGRSKPFPASAVLPAVLLPPSGSLQVLYVLTPPVDARLKNWALPLIKEMTVWNVDSPELGKALQETEQLFDLIVLEKIPGRDPDAGRRFVSAALNHLKPDGVLILPTKNRAAVQQRLTFRGVPGSNGHFVALSRSAAISVDLKELDRRLQQRQGEIGHKGQIMPPGVFRALYYEDHGLNLPAEEPLPLREDWQKKQWLLFCGALAVYLLCRIMIGRWGRSSLWMNFFENGMALTLMLLGILDVLQEYELWGPAYWVLVWPLWAFFFCSFPLMRAGAVRFFVLAVIVVPFFLPQNHYPIVWVGCAVLAALTAAAVQRSLARDSGFLPPWRVIFTALGIAGGGILFSVLHRYCPEPLYPAVCIAAICRVAWLLLF